MLKFRFQFFFGDDTEQLEYLDLRQDLTDEERENFWDAIADDEEANMLEETFGVHDMVGGYEKENDVEYDGFTSYEVTKEKVAELMQVWDKILKQYGMKQ